MTTVSDCPYGAADCPKINDLKMELKLANDKLNVLICVIIALHGAEIIGILGSMI